ATVRVVGCETGAVRLPGSGATFRAAVCSGVRRAAVAHAHRLSGRAVKGAMATFARETLRASVSTRAAIALVETRVDATGTALRRAATTTQSAHTLRADLARRANGSACTAVCEARRKRCALSAAHRLPCRAAHGGSATVVSRRCGGGLRGRAAVV